MQSFIVNYNVFIYLYIILGTKNTANYPNCSDNYTSLSNYFIAYELIDTTSNNFAVYITVYSSQEDICQKILYTRGAILRSGIS